jgi:hypothetical protein
VTAPHDPQPLIAVVGMIGSVHAARWLKAVRAGPFRFVVLPVVRDQVAAPEFDPLIAVATAQEADALPAGAIGLWHGDLWREPDVLPPPIHFRDRSSLACAGGIADAVRALRPVLVHSMELQHAGYACLGAAERMAMDFPPWLVSNWGSDIQLYRKLPAHRPVLEAIARRMDAYHSECERDIALARELGYRGPRLAAIPASCGACFATLPTLSDLPPPSARGDILIKGYHGWSGRALHVLSAVHLAAPRLRRFRIRIALAGPAVSAMADMIRLRDRLDIAVEPFAPSHAAAIARIARARMTVGLGISDGIGTSTLEAMALGSFPIVASSSCATEWLRPDRDGFVLSPHDVAGMARALQAAAEDDALVDAAALRNRRHVEAHWDSAGNGSAASAIYMQLLARTHRDRA